jgi:hypothetical protein
MMFKKSFNVLFAVSALSFNPKWVKEVDHCTKTPENTNPEIIILKQWHLIPSANTKNPPKEAKPFPQAQNQIEIYGQVSEWVNHGEVDTVIAEGCEGKIDSSTKEAYQGWNFSDLVAKSKDSKYSEILAHPVMKLKVKYPNLNAICGDNLAEIKKSQLALSDARADVGYETRLTENKEDPKKLKIYLEGAREAYSLPKDASVEDVIKAVKNDLKASIQHFQDSTHARDLSFVKAMTHSDSKKPVVMVVGGIHAEDLKKILNESKLNCTVVAPISYQNDEEGMTDKLKALITH